MDKTDISRFISLILRHKPDTIGITLDRGGWADVNELISGVNKRYKFTMKDLEDIVRTDNKQRYAFNSDKTKIRANQGHSIDVDLGLEPMTPPGVLYHGTAEKYISSIQKQGLISKSRQYVHLSDNIDTAVNVGARHGEPVVFIINAFDMWKEGHKFYKSQNGVWLTDRVPTKYLSVTASVIGIGED